MILPDITLLVYAYNEMAPHHKAAARWWERCLNDPNPVVLPWIVTCGFVRLMTHPRVLEDPMSVSEAIATIREWRARPMVITIDPGKKFEHLFFGYLEILGTAGNLTTDAYLAALAVEHHEEQSPR